MQSPEHSALDLLNNLKRKIPETSLSLLGTAGMSIHSSQAVDDTHAEAALALLKQRFTLGQKLIQTLIGKAENKEVIDLDVLSELIESVVDDLEITSPKKEELTEIVSELFATLLKDYPATFQKLYEHYELAWPTDRSHVLIHDGDIVVTQFLLQEAAYHLEMALRADCTSTFSFEQVPYLRHINIPEDIAEKITQAASNYHLNVTSAIDRAIAQINSLITENAYPETLRYTFADIKTQKQALAKLVKEHLAELKTINNSIHELVKRPKKNKKAICSAAKALLKKSSAIDTMKTQDQILRMNTLRHMAEFQEVPAGQALPEAAGPAPAVPRFTAIETIFNTLISQLHAIQHACAVSESDMGLKRFLTNQSGKFADASFSCTFSNCNSEDQIEKARCIYNSAIELVNKHFPTMVADIQHPRHSQASGQRLFAAASAANSSSTAAQDAAESAQKVVQH